MLSPLRQCALTVTQVHTSKVNFTGKSRHLKGQSIHACVDAINYFALMDYHK